MEFREFIISIGEPAELEKSHLGFFSKPVLATEGIYAGKVVKIYPAIGRKQLADALYSNHERYVPLLTEAGILVPETILLLLAHHRKWVPVVVQERFQENELVRSVLEQGNAAECARLVVLMQADALQFLAWRKQEGLAELDVGFHPTTRNYAIRGGRLRYFDTFPPMACAQKILNKWVPYLSPYKAARWLAPLISGQMYRVTTEYYLAEPMLYGLAGSACRLRPELAADILAASREFLSAHLSSGLFQKELLVQLEQPPRLGKLWTSVRKALGKEGKPNI